MPTEIPSGRKIKNISIQVASEAISAYQAALPVNKVDATTAPSGADNFAAGYSINSRWIDVTNDEAWVCVGDGVWQQTTAELASEIIYDNSGTNISSSTAQSAITELDTRVFANDAKVSADGSVTTHSDVTDAGSGAIITTDERTKLGHITVTQAVDLDTMESDITANNAKVSADGSVTTHSDITDAGSGAIITTTERTKLGHISISQAVDLDTVESDILSAKTKTDWITVTQAVDLDTMESDIATNNAKVSADGSVTTHSDVTDAGSGAIITVDERNKVGLITITLAVNLDTLASDVAANNAKVSNVTTDLSIGTVDAISVEIVSSDGTNAVLPLATGTLAGLMSAADKAKLDAIP